MISVVIPSRSDQWLQKTVDDLLKKAEEEIEVIVVYDGRYADPILKDHPCLVQVHHGELHNNYGMRASINAGARLARGDYLLVIDEQCMVDQGFDVALKADCKDNWVVIPRRRRLDAENWREEVDGRPPIDYMSIDYPYQRPYDKTCGLHGAEWKRPERADILIDDTPTMQGSCYFMKKSYWDELFPNGLDDVNYGTFTQEAQEVSLTAWLTGGEVKVNKKTSYYHWHKGSKGKGYGFSRDQYRKHMEGTEKGRVYCIEHWLYTKDYKYDWDWFMKKFPDMPGWPKDYWAAIEKDKKKDYSRSKAKKDWFANNAA